MTIVHPNLGALIEPVVRAIASHIPAPLPQVTLPVVPELAAAVPLAKIVGADPRRVRGAASSLIDDHSTISQVLSSAVPLIGAAAVDIGGIARDFMCRAMAMIPGLVTGFAGGNGLGGAGALAGLATDSFRQVGDRLSRLARDLAPLVGRLDAMISAALGRPPLLASPEAIAAEEELRSLAARAGWVDPAPAAAADSSAKPAGSATSATSVDSVAVPDGPVGMAGGGTSSSEAGGSAAGRAAVEAAKSQLGTPYVWGGSAPGGFDCSGLTSWAYRQAGVEIPRVAENQAIGRQVSYEELQPGDLVVWSGHVAMYAGDGMMVEAGDPVQMNPVRTTNIGMPFMGFWRPTAQ